MGLSTGHVLPPVAPALDSVMLLPLAKVLPFVPRRALWETRIGEQAGCHVCVVCVAELQGLPLLLFP